MERDGPPLLPDGSLDYTESEPYLFFIKKREWFLTCYFLLVEDPFSVLSFFAPEPQTRPHLVPLYPPLGSSTPLPPSTPISTSISTSSDVPPAPHTHAFPSTIALPLDYTPATLPFLNYNPQQPQKTPTSRRRHWTISRNTTRQKGKEKEDDHIDSFGGGGGFGVEVPAWQVAREAHTVDFGCFALLGAELEAEMRRRKLGVGVNGTTGSVLDSGEKEEDTMLGLVRSSLDCSQAAKNAGGGEDGAIAAPTTAPTPVPATRTARTGANLLANAYWTTQRAAEAEDYIRDVVYGGVDGLAYVRSLAEFVGDHRVRVFFRRQRELDFHKILPEFRYRTRFFFLFVYKNWCTKGLFFFLQGESSYICNPELGMPLAKWVEVNIVDPLTQGRHSLIRETALELGRLPDDAVSSGKSTVSPGSGQSPPLHLSKLPADPRAGTIPTQILASLHFFPPLLLALSSLAHIKMQKIDMGSLIKTPNELFVSEEEWFGKAIKERKAKAKGQSGAVEENEATKEDKMSVDESATTAAGVGVDILKSVKEEEEAPKARAIDYEVEGPEELSEVLDYVADVIVELDKRTRNGVKRDLESEDPLARNLRLNLLALAKRAPLDTIARLPMDLVPEHIRHFVPTLATL